MNKILEFYKETSSFTDLGYYKDFVIKLPSDIKELCLLQSKQTIHPFDFKRLKNKKDFFYGDLTKIPIDCLNFENDLFTTVQIIFAKLLRRNPNYTVSREAKDKINVCYREQAVLLASSLKAKGIPCRCRSGFASYIYDYIKGLVEFKNVSFSYKTKNEGMVNNISFIANPHEITALVGHSGSGKTTIINLLLRKYKIDSGKIFIDDEDIYEYSSKIYSKNVVAVNQSPFIFTMSIRKNLALIDPDINHQIAACKRVGIHDCIMSLPKGYNTILTDNAGNFSGGQKQLLSIARTLLSKAEVLIFDEVTSSLDPLLVEKIKQILNDLKRDHTIILITHKKDVMSIADKIIVLNKGVIVGSGTHLQLMKDNLYYKDLQMNNYSSSNKKM